MIAITIETQESHCWSKPPKDSKRFTRPAFPRVYKALEPPAIKCEKVQFSSFGELGIVLPPWKTTHGANVALNSGASLKRFVSIQYGKQCYIDQLQSQSE